MRILVIAGCVTDGEALAVAPGATVASVDGFTSAASFIRTQRVDVVVTPEAIGERQTGSCLDVARVARSRGVGCVIVTDVWEDGSYGAACVAPGGDLAAAVARALVARTR